MRRTIRWSERSSSWGFCGSRTNTDFRHIKKIVGIHRQDCQGKQEGKELTTNYKKAEFVVVSNRNSPSCGLRIGYVKSSKYKSLKI